MARVTQAKLAYELRVACMRIARKVRYEGSGLAPHLFTILAQVEKQPRTATELAAAEQVSAASMSRTVVELEQRGLITRVRHESDGRTRLISLTGAGHRELAENRRQRDTWMRDRLAACSPAERAVLSEAAAILDRMVCGDAR
ncbi:MarR family winged helix-turn-helix transcriptional regulator [Mariniluteicoccus flavus]